MAPQAVGIVQNGLENGWIACGSRDALFTRRADLSVARPESAIVEAHEGTPPCLACSLASNCRTALSASSRSCAAGSSAARWLEPEDYHITLRFIGDVDAGAARDIDETLSDIRRPKALVRFEELSWFGGGKPRAIVAKVQAEPALVDLQAEQERRLRRIGIEPETRKYTPHVTLARLRNTGPAAVANYLAERGALIADSFNAERFVLYSAREGSGGGPYVIEAAYPLD